MASGASGNDADMSTAMATAMDTVSPRRTRGVAATAGAAPSGVSPGPKRYMLGADAPQNELTLAEVVNDHARKSETITGILKILNSKNHEQDLTMIQISGRN